MSVLPRIVVAFIATGRIATRPMLVPAASVLALLLILTFMELRIASFDPDYATL